MSYTGLRYIVGLDKYAALTRLLPKTTKLFGMQPTGLLNNFLERVNPGLRSLTAKLLRKLRVSGRVGTGAAQYLRNNPDVAALTLAAEVAPIPIPGIGLAAGAAYGGGKAAVKGGLRGLKYITGRLTDYTRPLQVSKESIV